MSKDPLGAETQTRRLLGRMRSGAWIAIPRWSFQLAPYLRKRGWIESTPTPGWEPGPYYRRLWRITPEGRRALRAAEIRDITRD